MKFLVSILISTLVCLIVTASAEPLIQPSPEKYSRICETADFPDIPCFTFWRSDLKDAYFGTQLHQGNMLIKNDTYKDFGYTNVNQPFSLLFNDEIELLYGGRNTRNCGQFYVAKVFQQGRADFAHARVEVSDEDGVILHDSKYPRSGWSSNCKKWTHIKVWHG